MTKPELVTFIMEHTDQYKKTHLMEKYKTDLEQIAAEYTASEASAALNAAEVSVHTETPDSAESVQEKQQAPVLMEAVKQAYENNSKIVKGPRMDIAEFRETVIETMLEMLPVNADSEKIDQAVRLIITEYLQDKTGFCSINDTEKLMLATIPHLPDFNDFNSVMDGKGFLTKVQ